MAKVRALKGFDIESVSPPIRALPGETADIPDDLAAQWADEGIVELLAPSPPKSPPRKFRRDDDEEDD